jgi:acetylornithine deacetylase
MPPVADDSNDDIPDPVPFLEGAVETPSHEDPAAMRDLLVAHLRDFADGDWTTPPAVDEAGNVVASRGTGRPHLVLNTHCDTVPPHVPLGEETVAGEDRLTGRGTCDAKGSLAAMVAAFVGADPAGRVTLAVTPDEETDSTGAAHLVDVPDGPLPGPVDGVIVGEPTGLDACPSARGRFEGTVTIRGERAHAAEPANGRNAVAAAGPILDAIGRFDTERGPDPHDELGAPHLTATRIRGGEAANQIPAACEIMFDRRSVPPETSDGFLAALTAHLDAAAPDDVTVEVALTDRPAPYLEAFATSAEAPLVRTLADLGGGTVRPFGAATEASLFAELAPTVVFGPGVLSDADGPVAHADREYVPVDAVRRAARTLADLVELDWRG